MKLPSMKQYALLLPAGVLSGLGLVYLLDNARGPEANYAYIILYSLIGGLFSMVGGLLLLNRSKTAKRIAKFSTPFAAGALLSTVFIDLLPEGIEADDVHNVLLATLGGVILFFFAERFLHWFHHNHHTDAGEPVKAFIITGDAVHNALDGVAIAAAFLISVPTGIITTIAVAAHEIPHEMSDFGLLLDKGMSRLGTFLANAGGALATTVAAVITFALGSDERLPVGVLTGISAGLLLYIAMSDLIPELHERTPRKRLFHWQPLALLLGAVVVGAAITLAHTYLEPHHDAEASSQHDHHDH